MIPHRLTLRNFLSYREAVELDLRGLHLACISGPNGAGKSTILDGITWALFGKSRVKSDDDVVNRSAGPKDAAEVGFVFELEGALYRVIRRKAPGKTTELEFHAYLDDGNGNGRWQVVTEARARETQAEIERLLRMNYDVFTNASFLLQGKADEFTTKTPDKRKEILAEILGVSRWDDYKEAATERRKQVEADGVAVERQLAEVEAELAREAEHRRALEEAEARRALLTAEWERHSALVTLGRQNKAEADRQREALRRLAAELDDAARERDRVEATAAQRRTELAGHRALLDQRERIEADYRAWEAAEADVAAWQAKADAHNSLTQEMHPLQTAIANAESRLTERVRELSAREERTKAEAIRRGDLEAQLSAAAAEQKRLSQAAAEQAEQQEAWETVGSRLRELEVARHKREMEIEQLRVLIREMDNKSRERAQVEESRRSAEVALNEVVVRLEEMAAQRQRLADLSVQHETLQAGQERLITEGSRVRDDIIGLEADEKQVCPLCGQSMTGEHREQVLRRLRGEQEELRTRYRTNQATIVSLKQEIDKLEAALKRQTIVEKDRDARQAAVSRAESRLHDLNASLGEWRESEHAARLEALQAEQEDENRERETLEARREALRSVAEQARKTARDLNEAAQRVARLETQIGEIERHRREWLETGLPALEEARDQLARGSFAAETRATLDGLQRRLAAVGFDPAAFAAARARRDELVTAPEAYRRLIQAEAAVRPLEDALAEFARQRERLAAREAVLRDQIETGKRRLLELEGGIGDLAAAEAELMRVQEAMNAAERAVAIAQQWISVMSVRREDRQRLMAEKTALARRVALLRQLEEACGRKGVQALLIESALPEIEDYANELLESLTGGEMRVTFETQRSSKTKQDNLIETLDIRIADGNSERPYENYSGGEKFRVNFAVRLALSQVLARRAGARLRTLVIDEGFGSQDPEGRQRLVEAINAVQDEFACILVITHIDELRDKFPARIDVEKTPAGSRATVVAV